MVIDSPIMCQYATIPGTFLAQVKTGIVRDNHIVKQPERILYIPIYQGIYAFKPKEGKDSTIENKVELPEDFYSKISPHLGR
jgi:hypothetical protein